jgi:diaminobutyrate--2-oxoglutarate aminotransferase
VNPIHDVIGIGFGPANLSLAIAAEEVGADLRMRFLEKEPTTVWQGGMLLDGSDIQNHPFRDLVTLRNPRSQYSFVNFLYERERLLEHLNLPVEFPLRKEYAEYIGWAAGFFAEHVDYGTAATGIDLDTAPDGSRVYSVATAGGDRLTARSVVLGPGRTPYVPEPFAALDSPRVFHLSRYLPSLRALAGDEPRDVAIVGGSQSAVEIALDLIRRWPCVRVTMYIRRFGLRLKDTSPFSEEGFFPAFTNYYYAASRARKRELDEYMRPTNYSSVDGDVLHELYQQIYEQRLDGNQRVFVEGNREVTGAAVDGQRVRLRIAELNTREVEEKPHDLVILATGFRDLGPSPRQEPVPPLMRSLAGEFVFDRDGYLAVEPDYCVTPHDPLTPPLFLNGLCESSHGIGDAGSFSLLPIRAKRIVDGLVSRVGPAARPFGRKLIMIRDCRVAEDELGEAAHIESEVRSYSRMWPVVFSRAFGSTLHASDGRAYLDFFTGAGALNYGHNNPLLKSRLLEYLQNDGVVHSLDMMTEAKSTFLRTFDELVLRLRGLDYKVQFTGPTGTNAVEAALKLARKVTGRQTVAAFTRSFHGVSLGSLAVTSNSSKRNAAGAPLGPVLRLPFDGFSGHGISGLDLLDELLQDSSSGVEPPAAVIVETVQGEGGVNVASTAWLRRLADQCRGWDMLLIVDDIQVGCGRTGSFFSFEPAGVIPDIVCVSKAISGYGLPMALTLFRRELDRWQPGEHNGTFRGNNPAFVTATAALESYWSDDVLRCETERRAEVVSNRLGQLCAEPVAEGATYRGRGLIWGLELEAPGAAQRVSRAALRRGLLVETAGPDDEVVKLLPPLTATDQELDDGLDILAEAVVEVLGTTRSRPTVGARTARVEA